MDPTQLADMITGHKWVAVAAIAIGLVVRLLKSDTTIPIDIPPRLRVFLALALGPASGAIDKLIEGAQGHDVTWTAALIAGGSASLLAILGHNVVIESVRNGKEFVVPGLTKPGVPPSPGNPPSIDPPPMTPRNSSSANKRMALLFGAILTGCGLLTPAQEAKGALVAKDISCVIEHAYVDNAVLDTLCDLATAERKVQGHATAAAHREGVARKLSAMRAEPCVMDAGPDASTGKEGGK